MKLKSNIKKELLTMKVKFKDGTIKSCNAPTEQKVFKSGVPAGWILLLNLVGSTTSAEIDTLLTDENIAELAFMSDNEETTLFTITGYDKVSSSTIRYAEDASSTRVEIQLTKGV